MMPRPKLLRYSRRGDRGGVSGRGERTRQREMVARLAGEQRYTQPGHGGEGCGCGAGGL